MSDPSAFAPRTRALRLGSLAAAGLASALLGNACSVILSFEECSADSDCDFGPGWRCDDGRCVADGGDGDGDGDGNGDGGTETMGDTPCSGHSECVAAHSDTWMCASDGLCKNALSPECQIVAWPDDTPSDDVVFVASIMPTSPPFDVLVTPIQNATQLAIEDFNDETQLPSGERLGWVGCDSRGSAEVAVVAAEHLVDLGVPAIVGPVFSESVLAVAEQVTIPAGVFLITPTATNKAITNLDDNGLVWRPIASDVYQANALADRMDAVASETSTVVLFKDDAYGNDLVADAIAALGDPIAAVTKTYSYEVPPDMDDLVDEISSVLGPVVANDAPETVAIVGTNEAALIILTYLQVAASIDPLLIPERFILTHGAVPSMPTAISNAPDNASRQLLYDVMEGVAPIIFDEQNFAAFNIRYKIKFNDQDAITTSSLSYDSLLVIAFAMATVPEGEAITGARIAEGMARLVDADGTLISFNDGTDFIRAAVNALSAGSSVDLKGVSGELSFDLETGDVRTNLLGWEAEPIGGELDKPTITPRRMYLLDPEPAIDGTWMDL